jgi:hypothetical protein
MAGHRPGDRQPRCHRESRQRVQARPGEANGGAAAMTRPDEPIRPMTWATCGTMVSAGCLRRAGTAATRLKSTSMPGRMTSRCHRLDHACAAPSAATSAPPRYRTGSSGETTCPVDARIGHCELGRRSPSTRPSATRKSGRGSDGTLAPPYDFVDRRPRCPLEDA